LNDALLSLLPLIFSFWETEIYETLIKNKK
jgi:hypothetical protein